MLKSLVPFALASSCLFAQNPTNNAPLEFEVASIRVNSKCGGRMQASPVMSPDRFQITCVTAADLIGMAYGNSISTGRGAAITGGPAWLKDTFYDVAAKAPRPVKIEELLGPMLRTLLEDRMKLKIHHEPREAPVYFLTVIKVAKNLSPSEKPCRTFREVAASGTLSNTPLNAAPPEDLCGNSKLLPSPSGLLIKMTNATMDDFARVLQRPGISGRQVINKTVLKGRYDFAVEFARGPAPNVTPGNVQAELRGPDVFTALSEQLGLKLVSGNSPVETWVIDTVEKPSEN